MLANNNTLVKLYLYNTNLKPRGGMMLADALKSNSTLRMLEYWGSNIGYEAEQLIDQYIDRNKRGYESAKKAVLQVLRLGKIPTQELEMLDDKDFFMVLAGSNFKENYFTQMARELWKTRSDPAWWTPDERRMAGYWMPSDAKRRNIQSCIQCKVTQPKLFQEEGAPSRVFCGSYCQWIQYSGAPDLRGKTLEEIKLLL